MSTYILGFAEIRVSGIGDFENYSGIKTGDRALRVLSPREMFPGRLFLFLFSRQKPLSPCASESNFGILNNLCAVKFICC